MKGKNLCCFVNLPFDRVTGTSETLALAKRHPIQNIGAHHIAAQQPEFGILSNGISPYFKYQSNNTFTSW